MLKYIIVFLFCFSLKSTLSGQCPDKVALWNRLVFLKDSSNIADSIKFRELSSYLEKIKECPPINDSVNSFLLMSIGALYSYKKDYKTAIAYTLRSLHMIQSHIGEPGIDESQQVRIYHNLNIFFGSTGQITLQRRAIDSCITISLKLKKKYEFSIQHFSSKIEWLFAKGDYYHCLELASIGEDISRKSGYRPEDVFFYISWEINSFIFLKRFSEGSQKLEKSIAECIQSRNKTYLPSLLDLKATIAEKNGSTEDAILFAMQSFYFAKKIGYQSNCTSALNNLGYELYFKKLHQYDKALYYYQVALKYASANDSLTVLNNIANVYVQKGDFNLAFDFFQQAFNRIHSKADEIFLLTSPTEDILNNWNVEYLINLVLDKAEAHIKKYNQTNSLSELKSAISIYKSADRLMDKINISQIEVSSQLFWRSDNRRLYERAIESCYLSGNTEDAFYFFEKSRAVLLNNQLKEQETGDSSIMEMALIKKKILGLENQMAALNQAVKEYADLRRTLFANKEQLNHIDQLIKDRNPWYYQSLIDTNFMSLHSVQNKLLGNKTAQAILEFFNGDSTVYLLSITTSKSSITRINKTVFENSVDKYSSYLSDPALENKNFKGFVRTGQQLYHLIFDQLRLPEGRIIISPDGKYFPFESLITNSNNSTPEYFITTHVVSYTYSARFLLNDFTKNRALSSKNFLGVAPVQYPAAFQLASLSQSEISLEKISQYFGSTHTLVKSQASRTNFMQQYQGYKMIQLYTHASDSSSAGEPVIYFADSALYLSELIPEKKTAAQLIVLSACETGNGKLYKGEGVFSFNRGFASLGVPSSVINLWSVDNESTYKLTELFYKYVSEGIPLDISLQKAKLEFIASSSKEKRLPYYWAAAIIVGKTDPVKAGTLFKWQEVAVILGMLMIGLAFLLKKKK
jgi:CHAT domain-containing protein/Tfp pilus assembly protein PilF